MMSSSFSPERDIAQLLGIIDSCFKILTGDGVIFGEAHIDVDSPAAPPFSGRISLSGQLQGWISLGLDKSFLSELLTRLNEPGRDLHTMLDATGELTSIIVSNARAFFGQRLAVSTPQTQEAAWAGGWEGRPPLLFNLPFNWSGHSGLLLLALHA